MDRSASSGGWNRPGPRRERPGARRETENERFSDSGPVPSSIGRAASSGRNLWPRAPRPPRSDVPGGSKRESGYGNRGASRSSGASRPAPVRRSATSGGYPRQSQPRRSQAGPGKPFGRGARAAESYGGRGSAAARRELGGDQVEGRQAVRELLVAQRRAVREVWMMEGSDPAAILREIESLARSSHVPVRLVTQRQIQEVQGSEAPQGVVAFAEPLQEADLSDLVGLAPIVGQPDVVGEGEASPSAKPSPAAFLVVVDGVTDPQNLGALLRSAECAGVTGVVLPRHRSAHVTPTVAKVAAGAIEHVSVAVVPGVPGALQELERLGVWAIGLDEKGTEPLFCLELGDRPIALVIGAEGRGLAPLSRQRCDVLARIPLHGTIDSLNVSAAGAVAMFEVARQRSSQAT
ncbi:MAG: 23S rRNA (guanosine(2251)-2'-O)-methyltransferase RlmB [Acidimicrobiales bacterium]